MRPATLARLGVGGACLAAPGRLLGVVGGPDRDDARTQDVVRVLGIRLLAQGALDVAMGRRTRRLDVAIDLLHAASMVPVAVWSRSHRRAAATSGIVATAIAVLDVRDTPMRVTARGGHT